MKKILIYTFIVPLLLLGACNNWLDVKPKEQIAADDLFATYTGYQNALNGCYILLKDRNLYGENLTMSHIECLAHLWRITGTTSMPVLTPLTNFEYGDSNVEEVIAVIYEKMYNVIAQANMILHYMPETGSVIEDAAVRAMIEGEAYAIRAFCHFDILRLFGQLPQSATTAVRLPYAEKVSRTEYPAYYGYSDFVKKIEADLEKALGLLQDNDPIFGSTFTALNSVSDLFLGYRQHRLNYWAVKALQARFYLYVARDQNDLTKALTLAREIIDAKDSEGEPLLSLGGIDMDAEGDPLETLDISKGYLASPSECLMMLNVYNIMDYMPAILGPTMTTIRDTHLVLDRSNVSATPPADPFTDLFDGQGSSNNRRQKVWATNIPDSYGRQHGVLMKYYYDTSGTVSNTKNQVVPLLRLSEIYLIVMELSNDLSEVNRLYQHYMFTHNVNPQELNGGAGQFASLDAARSWVFDEYRREFYGEGQMFYTYKRKGSASMLWREDPVTEQNYIVPLPNTEYDPNM